MVVIKTRKMHTPTYCLLSNLALADLLTGAVGLNLQMIAQYDRKYQLCVPAYLLLTFFLLLSQGTVFLIALERYIAILHPFKYQRLISMRNVIISLVGMYIWATLIILYTPIHHLNHPNHPVTLCRYPHVIPLAQGLTTFITVMVLSFVVAVLYLRILGVARYQAQKIEQQRLSASFIENPNNQRVRRHMKRQTKTTIFLSFIAFYLFISWIPNLLLYTLDYYGVAINKLMLVVSVFLGMSNSAINPIIYSLGYADFRQTIMRVYCSKRTSFNASMNPSVTASNNGIAMKTIKY
ncbi:unnamed protein product [Owenia fusiformis]|uniref:G-protein coupled receptors family 1 profile domain-containing protein n=1 Tax=Owenia fusiformis TaxID=6347 RepID=A0A8S4P604_OWEFU|nr:unnamed protein product [Owenia fusiformis]